VLELPDDELDVRLPVESELFSWIVDCEAVVSAISHTSLRLFDYSYTIRFTMLGGRYAPASYAFNRHSVTDFEEKLSLPVWEGDKFYF